MKAKAIDSARVYHPTREVYTPQCKTEAFIVPLLRQEIDRVLREWNRTIGSRRVLDVGCGNQPYRKELEALGFLYSSQDAQQNPSQQVQYVAAFDQPLPPELKAAKKFQFILCTEVMEHMANWDQVFQNFHRLLEKNGEVFLTAPFVYPLHEEPYDFWRPTPHAFKTMANAHGFTVREEKKLGSLADVLGTMLGAAYDRIHYERPSSLTEKVRFAIKVRVLRAVLSLGTRFLQTESGQDSFRSDDLYVSNSFRLVKRK